MFLINYLDGVDATRVYLGELDSAVFPYDRYQDSIVAMNDVSNLGEIPPGEPPDIVLLFDETMPVYRIVSGLITMVNAYSDREAFGGRDVLDDWA